MTTVKELIKELKKMPKNLQVGVAMHDNSEDEVAGWVFSVGEITEMHEGYFSGEITKGEKCVVLRC